MSHALFPIQLPVYRATGRWAVRVRGWYPEYHKLRVWLESLWMSVRRVVSTSHLLRVWQSTTWQLTAGVSYCWRESTPLLSMVLRVGNITYGQPARVWEHCNWWWIKGLGLPSRFLTFISPMALHLILLPHTLLSPISLLLPQSPAQSLVPSYLSNEFIESIS